MVARRMPADGSLKRRTYTVHLLQGSSSDFDWNDFFREDIADEDRLELAIPGVTRAELFVWLTPDHRPEWATLFDDLVPSEFTFPEIRSLGAVLLVEKSNRIFALSFGNGHARLPSEVIVQEFGLYVTLNAINPLWIRTLETRNIDYQARSTLQKVQREMGLDYFQFDGLSDRVQGMKGRARIGSDHLGGKDSLRFTFAGGLRRLGRRLQYALQLFQSDRYKGYFPEFDFVRPIRDDAMLRRLEDSLLETLNLYAMGVREESILQLGPPDFLEEMQTVLGYDFVSSNARSGRTTGYDRLPQFSRLFLLRDQFDHNALRAFDLRALDSNQNTLERWPLLRCLYCEAQLGSLSYILTEGHWYVINDNYSESVNQAIHRIEKWHSGIPVAQSLNEDRYILELSHWFRSQKIDHEVLHRNRGSFRTRGQTEIEYCDLLTERGELIFAKVYRSSEGLSHLFSQAYSSITMLRRDRAGQALLNRVRENNTGLAACLEPSVRDGRFIVVLLIVSEKKIDADELPLLARIRLHAVALELKKLGVQLRISMVQCTVSS